MQTHNFLFITTFMWRHKTLFLEMHPLSTSLHHFILRFEGFILLWISRQAQLVNTYKMRDTRTERQQTRTKYKDTRSFKRVCSHFNKRWEWNNGGSSTVSAVTRKRIDKSILTWSEHTRRRLESGAVLTDMVNGSSRGATLEELTKMVWHIQIAYAWRQWSIVWSAPTDLPKVNVVRLYRPHRERVHWHT